MKLLKLNFLIVAFFAIFSCQTKTEKQNLSDKEQVTAGNSDEMLKAQAVLLLDKKAYPMNLLSSEAKEELKQAIIFDGGVFRGTGKTPLTKKELSDKQFADLLSQIGDIELMLYDSLGNEIAKGEKAIKVETGK